MQSHPTHIWTRSALTTFALLASVTGETVAGNVIPGTSLTPTAWYQADLGVTLVSGKVSVWADQSGNGNNVTQSTAANRPTFVAGALPYGKPTFRFNGTNRLAFATSLLAQSWTCFTIARPEWDASQKSLLCGGYNSLQWRIKRNTEGGLQNVVRRTVVQLLTGSTLVPTNSYNLLSMRITDGSPDLISQRLNGAPDGSIAYAAFSFTNAVTEISGGEPFRGDIAAMVVFTNSLTDAEIVAVESYLNKTFLRPAETLLLLK